ncbi:DUF418 domain-containing protein [Brevibacillus ginsengisoli]|uniref:DUF418 domain-containing protein n=1 Tax=Brevibacillus ginsengisoli TaxID=363854 RepID=UPI003CEE48A8
MTFQPVSTAERISLIDVLRGFAVFGILFVNIWFMSTPDLFFQRVGVLPEESAVNQGVRLVTDMFFAGKFYPILSFLFGLGFFLQMRRSEQKGERVYRFFSRRMFILFLIGIVHMFFLYNGDVLHSYAIIGCLLMLFYRRRNKTVLIWAISILVLFFAMFTLAFLQPQEASNVDGIANYKIAENTAAAAIVAYQQGTYGEWLTFHLQYEVLPNLMSEQIGYPSMFAMMLLGFYFGRIGVFESIGNYLQLFRKIRNISATISILVILLFACTRLGYFELGVYQALLGQFLIYGWGIFLSFLYISLLVLTSQKSIGKRLLLPMKSVGRMSLTNYMLQSILSIAIFAGLGLYAKLNLLTVFGYCLIVIAAEIGFSIWWMNRFPLGPMEWVWRRLSYGKLERVRTVAASTSKLVP